MLTVNLLACLEFPQASATVLALRHDRAFCDEVTTGQECGVLLDHTSFYAEQGGQTFDEGYMLREDDSTGDVSETKRKIIVKCECVCFTVICEVWCFVPKLHRGHIAGKKNKKKRR